MSALFIIHQEVRRRAEAICAEHGDWPCRKGCDDCCRHLAAIPRVTRDEWEMIATALEALPARSADSVRARIAEGAFARARPIVCPLLDAKTGTCLVYDARPVACRTYGFYADREYVLGCGRVERIGQDPAVVWGNHAAVEGRLSRLGPAHELHLWLSSEMQPRCS